MYLPKNKYSAPKHTPGGEFSLNGIEYVGWYIRTFKNEYYTGKAFSKDSKLLIKLTEETNVIDANRNDPFTFNSIQVAPSSKDRINGKWKRYFLKDSRNGKIIEVDKDKFLLFKKKSYVLKGLLEWEIKGPAENLVINGYTYYGASHQNKIKVAELEKTFPGLSSFVKDYSQFVE